MIHKKRKSGRPKLPKGEAKGKIVPVRLDPGDLRLATTAARASNEALSQWIRNMLRSAAERQMFHRTLHEAMEIVLRDRPDLTATASELGEAIGQRRLYARKDGACPKARQISARARKYPELFKVIEPGLIRLESSSSSPLQNRRTSAAGDQSLDFHPIEIQGEPLSATILRERR
jgi:hypothetical protein